MALLPSSADRNRIAALSSKAIEGFRSHVAKEAKGIPLVYGDNIEEIIKLKPDLVILASYNRPALKSQLTKLKVPTVTLEAFNGPEDLADNIMIIGRAIDRVQEAKKLVDDFWLKLKAVKLELDGRKSRPTILTYYPDGTIFGTSTTVDALIEAAGARNLARDLGLKGWVKLSREQLATLNPDFLLVTEETQSRDLILTRIQKEAGWRSQKAVKEGRLIVVPERDLLTLSHHFAGAVERFQSRLKTLAAKP